MRYTYTLDINAPVERVFDLLDDPEKLKLWLHGVEETRYVGERDPANPVGAKFKQTIREGGRAQEYDGEVTAYDKPKHLGVRIFNKQFSVQVDYRLTPAPGGTQLDYAAELACLSWLFRLMSRILGFFMRAMLQKQLSKLKEVAQAG